MNPNGEKLAFVVGHYKSGSTWLVNLLSLHPDVRGVSETHVFRYTSCGASLARATERLFNETYWAGGGAKRFPRHWAAEWSRPLRKRLGWARGQALLDATERPTTSLDLGLRPRRALRRRLERCRDGDEYCRVFFAFLLERLRPSCYLVEKTPTNLPHVPRIRGLFPQAKLVAIYRDGRDVVVSDRYHLARAYGIARSFEERVVQWKRSIEDQKRYAPQYGVHTLSYEALLDRPGETVRALLDHLELAADDSTVEDMIERSSFEFVTGRRRGTSDERAFYRKGVAGDWRNHYSDEEKETFSRIAGDLLVELGYESDPDWRAWGGPAGA